MKVKFANEYTIDADFVIESMDNSRKIPMVSIKASKELPIEETYASIKDNLGHIEVTDESGSVKIIEGYTSLISLQNVFADKAMEASICLMK